MTDVTKLEQWMQETEGENLEFKAARTRYGLDELTEYCVALANEGGGKIILGVSDKRPREVVGSTAFPQPEQTRGQLNQRLDLGISFDIITHPLGRVLVFHVPSRPVGIPMQFRGKFLVRKDESLVGMSGERLREIYSGAGHDFSADICPQLEIDDLSQQAIEDFRARWILKTGNQQLASLSLDQLLRDIEVEGARVQHIAISATVASPRRIADAYMGNDAKLVSVKGQRSIECKYVRPEAGKELADCVLEGIQQFEEVTKVLVFVNRRKDVDHHTDRVRERVPKHFEVFGHHGSLGTSQREFVERQYRSAKYAVCIATMTLEIGIDIGDVDLVVCVDPPSNLASFLQRIGRGCRRRQSATRVLCYSSSAVEETIFRAFELGAQEGIPQVATAPLRRSVLFQQILAYLRQTDKQRRTEAQFCRMFCTEFEPQLSVETVEAILKDMIASQHLYLHEGVVTLGQLGEEFVDSHRIYSNLDPKTDVPVVDRESGRTVAYVSGIKSDRLTIAGERFVVSGQQTPGTISVKSIQNGLGTQSPEYSAKAGPGYSGDTGACLARFLNLGDSELLLLRPGFVFTWFGRLHNAVLAECLSSSGFAPKPRSFGIDFGHNVECDSVLDAISRSVESIEKRNVKFVYPLESLADCGAHHCLLGSQQRDQCRIDWVDVEFLRQWINRIKNCQTLAIDDPRLQTLRLLAAV